MTLYTYHCHCSTLLLATHFAISTLPKRADPGLDKACILLGETPPVEHADTDQRSVDTGRLTPSNDRWPVVKLLSTVVDKKPVVIRRPDGFEKRWPHRCARCRVVVAYTLSPPSDDHQTEGSDAIYVLEDGLVSTDQLSAGVSADTAANLL